MEDEAWRQALDQYMTWKGYPGAVPVDVDYSEASDLCWVAFYDLPSGQLEVEVAYRDGKWQFNSHLGKPEPKQR